MQIMTGILGLVGLLNLYLALIWSPPEAQMGNMVRVMYFHVCSAWIALVAFFVTFLCSCLYLRFRNVRLDEYAHASAEIGVVFTTLTLISGSLWGRAVWNAWWTWDPRLTTTLILWFLYVGYLLLRGTIAGMERRARVSAVYAIVAFVDVPIIHMSVTWWRSIHPNVIDDSGFHMPGSMVVTLMFGFVSFLFLYLLLLYARTRQASQQRKLIRLRQKMRELEAGMGRWSGAE
jgi:heme exporter protein C